jgi:hypothetical protein
MDLNFKTVHVCALTIPRSLEKKLQQDKEILRMVELGVLEEDYSSEWASLFPKFEIDKNTEQ